MMRYYILRNNTEYGPYEVAVLKQYVDDGRILLHDQAKDSYEHRRILSKAE